MKSNHFERIEDTSFGNPSNMILIASGKVSYFEILGGCTLTSYLKDPTFTFVRNKN